MLGGVEHGQSFIHAKSALMTELHCQLFLVSHLHWQARGHKGGWFPGSGHAFGSKTAFPTSYAKVKETKATAHWSSVTPLFKVQSGFV